MHHSALNVYCWDRGDQNRVLTECLGPALRELWDAGALRRLWFHRFDARGPHVTVFLGAPPGVSPEVRDELGRRLDAYFAQSRGGTGISREELEQRHAECRGTQLCSLDTLPSFAPNRSHASADHRADGYLFGLAEGMDGAAVDELLGDLAHWSIAQLRAGGTGGGAVRWVAGLDAALARAGVDTEALWRYYASTLLPALRERIAAGDPELVAGLPAIVGERNRAVLARRWDEAEARPPVWAGMDRLAERVAAAEAPTPRRIAFVREVSHSVLAQLDQYVSFRIPLILYAWLRSSTQPQTAAS